MKIYIHADDAGAGPSITNDVLLCWEKGYIDGFSILADKDCCSIIEEKLRKYPEKNANLSVHLNLSDGNCIGLHREMDMLTDAFGKFKLKFSDLLFILLRGGNQKKKFLQQVHEEWDKQISYVKLIAGARKIFAIDGHNHVHMIPPLFKIATGLAQKHGIEKIRFSREYFFVNKVVDCLTLQFWINYFKNIVLWIFRVIIRNNNILFYAKTDVILGVQYSGQMTPLNIKAGKEKAKKQNAESIEIIVHPGQSNETEIRKYATQKKARKFYLSKWRRKEFETVKAIADGFKL